MALPSAGSGIFSLNPPTTFDPRDLVVMALKPEGVKIGMTNNAARDSWLRIRLDRLVKYVEFRLGKHRCLFRELPGDATTTVRQLEVKKVYALFEVAHWPDAAAQADWTSFIFAEIERDNARQCFGYNISVTLPTLPATAVPIFHQALQLYNDQYAWLELQPGGVDGITQRGTVNLYNKADPRRRLLPKNSALDNQPPAVEDQARLLAIQHSPVPHIDITNPELEQLLQNSTRRTHHMDFHRRFMGMEYAALTKAHTFHLARKQDGGLYTLNELGIRARKEVDEQILQCLHADHPEVANVHEYFKQHHNSVFLVQFALYKKQYEKKDPIMPNTSPEAQRDQHRVHEFLAMSKQRRVMQEWATAAIKRATKPNGVRFRKDRDVITDLITGDHLSYEAFDAKHRNHDPNFPHSSDELPMAKQPSILKLRKPAKTVTIAGLSSTSQRPDGPTPTTTAGKQPFQDVASDQSNAKNQVLPETRDRLPVQTSTGEQARPSSTPQNLPLEERLKGSGEPKVSSAPEQNEAHSITESHIDSVDEHARSRQQHLVANSQEQAAHDHVAPAIEHPEQSTFRTNDHSQVNTTPENENKSMREQFAEHTQEMLATELIASGLQAFRDQVQEAAATNTEPVATGPFHAPLDQVPTQASAPGQEPPLNSPNSVTTDPEQNQPQAVPQIAEKEQDQNTELAALKDEATLNHNDSEMSTLTPLADDPPSTPQPARTPTRGTKNLLDPLPSPKTAAAQGLTGTVGTKCHHCIQTGSICNNQRPCDKCPKYKKNCYDTGATPEMKEYARRTQAHLKKDKKAKTQVADTKSTATPVSHSPAENDAEDSEVVEDPSDTLTPAIPAKRAQTEATDEPRTKKIKLEIPKAKLRALAPKPIATSSPGAATPATRNVTTRGAADKAAEAEAEKAKAAKRNLRSRDVEKK